MNSNARHIQAVLDHAEHQLRGLKNDETDLKLKSRLKKERVKKEAADEITGDVEYLLSKHSTLCEYMMGELEELKKKLTALHRNRTLRNNNNNRNNNPTNPN